MKKAQVLGKGISGLAAKDLLEEKGFIIENIVDYSDDSIVFTFQMMILAIVGYATAIFFTMAMLMVEIIYRKISLIL